MSPEDACARLHELLEKLPIYDATVNLDLLPSLVGSITSTEDGLGLGAFRTCQMLEGHCPDWNQWEHSGAGYPIIVTGLYPLMR